MSRVLSRVIICLGRLSPAASSDQPEAGGPRHRFCSVLLRMGFTEPPLLPGERWSLTPPFHPYRPKPAVSFCCTFLGVASTGHYPLSLPCEARTFLVCGLSAHAAAITCPAPIGSPSGNGLYYHITFGGSFQSSFLLQLPQCPQEAQFSPKSQPPQEPLPRCRSIRQTAAAASKSTTASTR